MKFKALQG